MRNWSSAIRSSAAARRVSKSSHESAPREPESPVAGRFSWSVIAPPSLYPGRTTCPGRLHATPEAHFGDAREMLTIDALGGREQLRRQAGRGRLELEPDDPPVEDAEVERDRTREVAVVLEQERGPKDVGGTRRAKCEVRDIGGRVVREAHRILRNHPRCGGWIGGGRQGAGSRSVVTTRECDPRVPARVARMTSRLRHRAPFGQIASHEGVRSRASVAYPVRELERHASALENRSRILPRVSHRPASDDLEGVLAGLAIERREQRRQRGGANAPNPLVFARARTPGAG